MYSCPSHEKHTTNAPLKTPTPPPWLGLLDGGREGGFRIRKRCLSEARVACLNSAAQLLRKLHTVYISLHEKRNSFKRNYTALNTRIFCYFGIAICQALLSFFFSCRAFLLWSLVMGEVETRVPYGRRFNSLTPRSNL